MKKRIVIGGVLILLVICLFFLGKLFAYSTTFTHPHLTKESVKFYEKFESDYEFSNEEIGWLVKGNQDEDASPRYINHFYDPKNNLPWLGSNPVALTAKDWVNSSKTQSLYTGGDQSFKRAVYEYREGNIKEAFVALGHILHLVQDMSVPDHTRDDTHVPGAGTESPYEKWAENYNKNYSDPIAKKLIDKNKQLSRCFSLDNCFDEVANYSNGYFFSIDSVDNYNSPSILKWSLGRSPAGDLIKYGYCKDIDGTEFRLIVGDSSNWRNFSEITNYKLDDNVLSDYWERLSAKSVQTGAQVINLFFKQIQYEEENNIPNIEPLSWWKGLLNDTRVLLGLSPKIGGKTVIASEMPVKYLSSNSFKKVSLVDTSEMSENDEEDGENNKEEIEDSEKENKNNEIKDSEKDNGNTTVNVEDILFKDQEVGEQSEENDNQDSVESLEEEDGSLVVFAETETRENSSSEEDNLESNTEEGVGGPDEDIEEEITEAMNDAIAEMENRLLAQNNTEPTVNDDSMEEALLTDTEEEVTEEGVEDEEELVEEEEEEGEEPSIPVEEEGQSEEDSSSAIPAEAEIQNEEEEEIVDQFYTILVSEIRIEGEEHGSTTDEFVELYNPNNVPVSLAGWKLRPFTRRANPKSYLLRPFPDDATIPAYGYYLIAHENYTGSVLPDAYYSTQSSISNNNSLILYDENDNEVDVVGWKNASVFEEEPVVLRNSVLMERKARFESTTESMSACGVDEFGGNGFDSNINYEDFVIKEVSDPQNSNSLAEPREGVSESCFVEIIEEAEEEVKEEEEDVVEEEEEEDVQEEDPSLVIPAEEENQSEEDPSSVIPAEAGIQSTEEESQDDEIEEEEVEEDPVVVFEGPPVLTGSLSGETMVLVPELSPYIVSNEFVVEENATLVIEAGVILKFGKEYMSAWHRFPTRMRVEGNLFVNGTEENPVVFTSIADDRIGGDTNLDGNATNPGASDWSRLLIESQGNHQVNLSHAHFYFAGSDNGSFGNGAALVSRGGVVVNVDHCYFAHNPTAISNFAWHGPESKPINVTNSLIELNESGIILDVYAPLRLFHTTIRNNNDYGIYLEASSPDVFYAKHNNIYNNSRYGLWNFYGAGAKSHALPRVEISAQENWWGDASGPAPMGEGNEVGGEVDFSNWLSEEIVL